VTNQSHDVTHIARLNDLVSELKQYGKSVRGSIVVTERRSQVGQAEYAKDGTTGQADPVS
jgi:hypothetical protein